MTEEIVSALANSYPLIVPEAILGLAACVLFVGGTIRPSRHLSAVYALAALAAAALALYQTPLPENYYSGLSEAGKQASTYAACIYWDQLALWIKVVALAGGAILVLFSWNEVPDGQAAEFHGCLLIIVAGLCLTGAANELITLFLALELISIPTYIILYLPRHDVRAQEAAMKYFLLSVFSSALLLFGFSYLYGLAGTTNLPALLDALANAGQDMPAKGAPFKMPAMVALVMVAAGFSFRIAAVPFHFYAPDVYQGAPTPVVALLAFIPKVAGFVGLVRVLGFVYAGRPGDGLFLSEWVPVLLWILSAVTMSLGNILALLQNNVKRLLAYSSVAHAGYMLIGLAVAYQFRGTGTTLKTPGGVEAVLFYLVAYGAMTVGAFAVLSYLSTPEKVVEMEDDLSGLSKSHPCLALVMALFLFSLIGLPFTAGFWGKFFLFLGALAGNSDPADHGNLFRWLAIIGAVNAAIGGWYYLRIVARMYLHSPVKPLEKRRAWPGLITVVICAVLTLGIGLYPGRLMRTAVRAALSDSRPSTVSEGESQPSR